MQNLNGRNACSIRHRDIRAVLTNEQLHKLESVSRLKSYKAGEALFHEGDTATHSFIVISGALKLTKIHPGGERHVIGLMFQDDLLCRAFKPLHCCSAEAAADLALCAMPLETVLTLCEKAPNLERVLFRAALTELEANYDWMLLLRGCSAYQRVAGFLRLLAKRAQSGGTAEEGVQVRFTLPLSRAEIAGFLGITIETVSRQLTLMRKKGVIELPVSRDSREVVVPNLATLSAHAEYPSSEEGAPAATPAFANPEAASRAAAM